MSDFEGVAYFVHCQIGYSRTRLTRDSIVDKDLKIGGDDAFDFMELFFEEFDVNPAGFDYNVYFDGEGLDPIGIGVFIGWLRGVKMPSVREELTLGELEAASVLGEWPEARTR